MVSEIIGKRRFKDASSDDLKYNKIDMITYYYLSCSYLFVGYLLSFKILIIELTFNYKCK